MRSLLLAGFAAATLLTAAPAVAQTPLFSENTDAEAVIEGPLNTIIRQAVRNTDPHPATFTLTSASEPQTFNIELSARGVSRRTLGICTFPPLRLNFEGQAVRGTAMRGQNRLKLVTQCRPGSQYEQMIALEYLAYRIYNEITPYSFRARPVNVTFRDSDGRRAEERQWNYLIEDESDLARRNGDRVALDVAAGAVRFAELDPRMATEYALFQFMIGNLDWDMVQVHGDRACCHNTRLLATSAESRERVIPVPYDFDSSGLVNAPYAVPPAQFGLRNVRQRYYRGVCRFNDQIPAAIATFQSRREAINALIAADPRLNDIRRQSTQRYIDEFYEIIADQAQVQRQIIGRCRG
jgi:hypothetical protein